MKNTTKNNSTPNNDTSKKNTAPIQEPSSSPLLGFLMKTIFVSGLVVALGILSLSQYFQYKQKQDRFQTVNVTDEQKAPTVELSPKTHSIKIFFTKDGIHLSPHIIEMEKKLTEHDKAAFILQTLTSGPDKSSSFSRTLPEGLQTGAIFMVDDKMVVDLEYNSGALSFGSVTDEMLCVYSIVNSLIINCPTINKVQILINTSAPETFGGFIDTQSCLVADYSLIK